MSRRNVFKPTTKPVSPEEPPAVSILGKRYVREYGTDRPFSSSNPRGYGRLRDEAYEDDRFTVASDEEPEPEPELEPEPEPEPEPGSGSEPMPDSESEADSEAAAEEKYDIDWRWQYFREGLHALPDPIPACCNEYLSQFDDGPIPGGGYTHAAVLKKAEAWITTDSLDRAQFVERMLDAALNEHHRVCNAHGIRVDEQHTNTVHSYQQAQIKHMHSTVPLMVLDERTVATTHNVPRLKNHLFRFHRSMFEPSIAMLSCREYGSPVLLTDGEDHGDCSYHQTVYFAHDAYCVSTIMPANRMTLPLDLRYLYSFIRSVLEPFPSSRLCRLRVGSPISLLEMHVLPFLFEDHAFALYQALVCALETK